MNTSRENAHSQGVWENFHGRLLSFVSRRVKQPADELTALYVFIDPPSQN
jgi:hypothetical protein